MRRFSIALLTLAALVAGCGSSSNKKSATTAATQGLAASVAATQQASAISSPITAAATAVTSTRVPTQATPSATRLPSATAAPTARPDESAIAKAMLLTVNDFPAGWAETPSNSNSAKALDKCKPPTTGQTGKADTGDFGKGDAASLSEGVGLFSTAQLALGYLDALPGMGECFVKAINGGALDSDQASISNATFSPVSFSQFGDRTVVYRVKFHAKVKGQTGLGSEADGYIDIVYVVTGRAAFLIEGVDVVSPFNTEQLQQFTKLAFEKVQKSLPAQ